MRGGRADTRARRFWAKVNKNGPVVRPELGPCWLWMGCILSSGYGQIDHILAHGLSWSIHHGSARGRLFVLHRCDVRACVNPEHLFLGTHGDNMADMRAKGRNARGESINTARLTANDVIRIRAEYVTGSTQMDLAAKYGVGQAQISSVVRGRSWAHLPGATTVRARPKRRRSPTAVVTNAR